MPTLYLLCGLPFSGKSTLARRLRDECGFDLISLDAINEERGLHGEEGISVAEWEATNQFARERVIGFMNAQRDIVVDDTNCYLWIRDRWRDVAKTAGYQTVVIYLLAGAAELQRRIDSCTNRRVIAADVFDECIRTFEPPSGEESITLRAEAGTDAFVESRKR